MRTIGGSGGYWGTVYWPKSWFLSPCDLCVCVCCEWLLARCHPDVGDEPGKKSCRGDQTWDIPDAQRLSVSKKYMQDNLRSPQSNIHYALNHFSHFRVMFPLEPVWELLTSAIQNIYNKLLSFWRNISLPKSIVTLSTQTLKTSFEKACLSAVISSILMVLYGVLSSGTFPNAAQPFSPPLY